MVSSDVGDSGSTGVISVLLDPFITDNPLHRNLDLKSVAAGLNHIIVSHGHTDHIADLVEIAKLSNALVTANHEICVWAKSKGVRNVNPMNTGGTVDLGAFKVSLTIAHHSSSHVEEDGTLVYLGNPNGIVIEAVGEPTLYYAGDTSVFTDMALIDEFYKPRIGILPIGDRFTMDGRKAAFAAKKYFHFSHVIPCHYMTYDMIDQNADGLANELAGSGVEVYAPKPGGTVEIK